MIGCCFVFLTAQFLQKLYSNQGSMLKIQKGVQSSPQCCIEADINHCNMNTFITSGDMPTEAHGGVPATSTYG